MKRFQDMRNAVGSFTKWDKACSHILNTLKTEDLIFRKSNVEWVTQIQTTSHKSMHNLLSGVLCEISPDFPNIMNMNRRWTHDSWNLGLHVHFWIKYDTEVASLMNARYFRAPDDYLICREFTKLPSGANKHVFGFYFHSTSNNFHSSICGWTLNMTPSFEYQH